MESLKSITSEKYKSSKYKLENDFNKCLKENKTFSKLVERIDLPYQELMKYTSCLEDSAKELDCCKNCKNILECTNTIEGFVYYPSVENDNLVFSYIPCKYQKDLLKKTSYQENISLFEMPKEIKNASMKDIFTDDSERFETIKWITQFVQEYPEGKRKKGLFLTGNFGCGKTYLISAMLNELAKKDKKVAIIYFPEFLRKLKESFSNDSYQEKFNYIKKVELLLIDDIGAETTTSWGRDEVLGTILQYRMDQGLTTFFTSNLTLKELEEHLSFSSKGVEKIKARRIIERIKHLTENMVMISENRRK